MPAHDLPGRVRELMEVRGLKQVALAEAIGLDAAKMSKSMTGTRRFTSLEVALLAEELGVTVNALLGIVEPEPAIAARASGAHVRPDPALQRLAEYAQVRASLAALGYPGKIPSIAYSHEPMWIDQGARLAEGALDYFEKCRAEFGKRDLATEIEDAFGIDVVQTELELGNDGFSHREGDIAVIAVATTDIPARQRFTLAHELAHVLAGDDQGLHIHGSGPGPKNASEVRANAFAAALLMPEADLRLDPRVSNLTDQNFASLVMDLAVSPNALAWRLWNLQLLTDERERQRLQTFSAGQCAGATGQADRLAEWCETGISPRPPMRLLKDSLDAYLTGTATVRLFARTINLPEPVILDALDRRPADDPAGM